MKIVRTIEDINEDCWCRLTEENLNNLKKLGFKLAFETFEEYVEDSAFEEEDIFYIDSEYKLVSWHYSEKAVIVPEIKFELEEAQGTFSSLKQYGFKNSTGYDIEILKVYENKGKKEYVGVIIFKDDIILEDDIIPMKWNSEGKSLIGLSFNLEPIEYKQRLYTKPNNEGFLPKQKFKVSWTRDMSSSLESSGWRLATNEEIERFKGDL